MTFEYILRLENDIAERQYLLKQLTHDHWLYDMQKATLDSKIRELEELKKREVKQDE